MKKVWDIIKKAFELNVFVIIGLVTISAILLYIVFYFSLSKTFLAYLTYPLSFYALSVMVYQIVKIVKKIRREEYISRSIRKHEVIRMIYENKELRFFLLFIISAPINILYSIYKIFLGGSFGSWWIFENGLYGIVTTSVRLILFHLYYKGGEREKYSIRFTICVMPILILIYVLMLYNMLKTSSYNIYPGHLIYLEALYVFTKMGTSIKLLTQKTQSPSLASARILKISQALVSIIFLAGSMIFTFSDNEEGGDVAILLISGIVVLILLLTSPFFLKMEEKRLCFEKQK